jgi:hypothetical protein
MLEALRWQSDSRHGIFEYAHTGARQASEPTNCPAPAIYPAPPGRTFTCATFLPAAHRYFLPGRQCLRGNTHNTKSLFLALYLRLSHSTLPLFIPDLCLSPWLPSFSPAFSLSSKVLGYFSQSLYHCYLSCLVSCLIVINLIPNLIRHRRLPLPLIPE